MVGVYDYHATDRIEETDTAIIDQPVTGETAMPDESVHPTLEWEIVISKHQLMTQITCVIYKKIPSSKWSFIIKEIAALQWLLFLCISDVKLVKYGTIAATNS